MPTYVYECEGCSHRLEERRAIVDRQVAGVCPLCRWVTRLVPSPPLAVRVEQDRFKKVRRDIRGGRS